MKNLLLRLRYGVRLDKSLAIAAKNCMEDQQKGKTEFYKKGGGPVLDRITAAMIVATTVPEDRAAGKDAFLRSVKNRRIRSRLAWALTFIMVIGIAAFFMRDSIASAFDALEGKLATTTAAATTSVSTTAKPAKTAIAKPPGAGDQYVPLVETRSGNIVPKGVAAIRDCNDPKLSKAAAMTMARKGANDWFIFSQMNPVTLSLACRIGLDKKVAVSALSYKGFQTPKAKEYIAAFMKELAKATITPALAPTNGYNTSLKGATIIGADHPGISGDRRAIKIVFADGREVYILWRCGNIVTLIRFEFLPKNIKEDAFIQGNADIYGGPNADNGSRNTSELAEPSGTNVDINRVDETTIAATATTTAASSTGATAATTGETSTEEEIIYGEVTRP